MRLIVMLRNPIERAYSHWAMEHRRGNDPLPFASALEQEEARCRGALPLQHRVFSYVDRGFYSAQLRRLWRFFGRDQVLVLRQEELRLDPKPVWKESGNISAFHQVLTSLHSNAATVTMTPLCLQSAVNTFARSSGKRSVS